MVENYNAANNDSFHNQNCPPPCTDEVRPRVSFFSIFYDLEYCNHGPSHHNFCYKEFAGHCNPSFANLPSFALVYAHNSPVYKIENRPPYESNTPAEAH